ncbi:MAG TPA: AsmA-like C-terminal domain-containing protein, partial [Syntrophorhabdales bacterium]|nr:AsmA-like C-terminal domain-containing protein [Syntrophorhabdales bacterium]
GKGKAEALAGSLKGTVEFEAKKGRIDRYGLLAKIFQVLSPMGILKIPDLAKEGFSYHVIKASGNLQDGKVTIKEALVDSSATDLVFNGEIDLIDKRIDAVVLVVPFRTIDRIINFIPLVRYVMAGRLVAIPVRVTGDLENPEVTPFSPSAVGAGLLDTVKRIFHLPLKLIQPLLPRESQD